MCFKSHCNVCKKGRFLPSVNKENCKNARGCHRCLDTCPGIGVDLIGLSEKFFYQMILRMMFYWEDILSLTWAIVRILILEMILLQAD